jgi:Protein of unknown function (DUF3800)
MVRLIAFDESGNTGADLLNKDQPTFVLASCDYSIEEAEVLLENVGTNKKEVKFSSIKRSVAGQMHIIRFLSNTLLIKERAKVFYFHKEYMALTKVVDLLVESVAYRDGIDLYKDGLNIALSNLHYSCIPVLCGEQAFRKMLENFVRMFRERTHLAIDQFYCSVALLQEQCKDDEYKILFASIMASNELITDILQNNNVTSLDPAIPGFFTLATSWGKQLETGFKILHDQSKPIACEKETLELIMDLSGPYREIGYDRRTFEIPIRSDGIEFGDSKIDARLQVADLISGSCNHWIRGLTNVRYQDDLWAKLSDIDMSNLAIGIIWPSSDVTPDALGTSGGGGVNPVDAMETYFAGKQQIV